VGPVNRDGMKFVRMELLKADWKEIRDEKFADLESVKSVTSL
jgi:glycine cleavage system H lipoate-binding protein